MSRLGTLVMNGAERAGVRSWSPASAAPLGVYVLFTLSGAAALVYQILWARWLSLIFGNTTPSVSIVLGSFMLGLALGSAVVGRMLPRIRNPMLLYAGFELGIGLFALLFPALTAMVDRLFGLMVTAESALPLALGLRAALVFALLVIPTSLMGATLPLLTEFFRRDARRARSWRVGLLYAANTIGAAAGALAASFLLIEWAGVRNTTFIAAGLNCAVALVGLGLARAARLRPAEERAGTRLRMGAAGRVAVAVLAASGALALASEVLWTRTLEIIVGNSSYAFALILVVYLIGIAAGSYAASLFVNRLPALPLWLAGTQAAIGLWILGAIALFDLLAVAIGKHSFTPLPIQTVLGHYLKSAMILFPLAFLSGAVFPIATRIIDPTSRNAAGVLIARAYAWNTIGAVAGALIGGFAIAPHFDYFRSLYFLTALYGGVALAALACAVRWGGCARARIAAGALTLTALAALVLSGPRLDNPSAFTSRLLARTPDLEIPFHESGLQGVTTVLRQRGAGVERAVLLINGTGMTRKVTDVKMMAHIPMLLHGAPEGTLIIGFGMGTTYRSAIAHGGDVTVVELVKEVYDAFDAFYPDAARVRAYPRGRMVVNDGRNFLRLTRERFDVITIDPPPPIDAAGVNNLYSREFLELARERLAKGGIVAHWIPMPGNGAGVNDRASFFMLVRTFAEVFPYTVMVKGYSGVGVHVLGSLDPITADTARIARGLARPAVASDLHEWDSVPAAYFQGLRPVRPEELEGIDAGRTVSDDRPNLEFDLIRSWRTGTQKVYQPVVW